MYYLHYDVETLAITGSGFTPDGTFPAGTLSCTQEQAAFWGQWRLVADHGTIQLTPVNDTEDNS